VLLRDLERPTTAPPECQLRGRAPFDRCGGSAQRHFGRVRMRTRRTRRQRRLRPLVLSTSHQRPPLLRALSWLRLFASPALRAKSSRSASVRLAITGDLHSGVPVSAARSCNSGRRAWCGRVLIKRTGSQAPPKFRGPAPCSHDEWQKSGHRPGCRSQVRHDRHHSRCPVPPLSRTCGRRFGHRAHLPKSPQVWGCSARSARPLRYHPEAATSRTSQGSSGPPGRHSDPHNGPVHINEPALPSSPFHGALRASGTAYAVLQSRRRETHSGLLAFRCPRTAGD
jgi:hypothetical protein